MRRPVKNVDDQRLAEMELGVGNGLLNSERTTKTEATNGTDVTFDPLDFGSAQVSEAAFPIDEKGKTIYRSKKSAKEIIVKVSSNKDEELVKKKKILQIQVGVFIFFTLLSLVGIIVFSVAISSS